MWYNTLQMKGKKVFVGLSGGVDSSVSALLLKQAGYEVTGVYIKGWQPEWIECTWKEERLSAMRTAALLDIPFLTLDAEDTYKTQVADYMLREYAAGRTPNGDMLCNKEVKFGVFLRFALENGADYIATGHYAQTFETPSALSGTFSEGRITSLREAPQSGEGVRLFESNDKEKDQTYFLSQLTQSQLNYIIFPIGHLQKFEVRQLAAEANLPVATRKDSQGICFVGDMSMEEWLKRELNPEKGAILNTSGENIGSHDGAILYTIGQRHGFKIDNNIENQHIYYVVAKDLVANTITVSDMKLPLNSTKDLKVAAVSYTNLELEVDDKVQIRLRYRSEKIEAKVMSMDDNDIALRLEKEVLPASGQFAVFYKGEECLGGGVVA